MTERFEFTRIVLGLPYSLPGHSMKLATELANLLRLDLFGLFVEDENLKGLAALPFAREFRPLGGGWQPLNAEQVSHDIAIAQRNAEKMFTQAAKTLSTASRFEVVSGSMAKAIASISRAEDIVLITEPEQAADRASPQFFSTLDAALRSTAAVLLVPSRLARHSGVIVAMAARPDDPSIAIARSIAGALGERLVVVEKPAPGGGAPLGNVAERLIVLSRADEPSPSAIASTRQVPILLLEPIPRKYPAGGVSPDAGTRAR